MGWDGTFTTKAERVESLNRECSRQRVIKHSLRGARLWQIVEIKETGERFIRVYLVRKVRGTDEIVTKGMSESEGPFYYDCPLKFLDEVPVANEEWRNEVLKRAKSKVREKLPQIGTKVKLIPCIRLNGKDVGEEEVKILDVLRGKQYRYVVNTSAGRMRCGLKHFDIVK